MSDDDVDIRTESDISHHAKEATRHITHISNEIAQRDEQDTGPLEKLSLTLLMVNARALAQLLKDDIDDSDDESDFKVPDDKTFK